MRKGPTPGPGAEVEAFRQGRPPKPDMSERVARALGLEALRSRRARRHWRRIRPYVIVLAIGGGAMLAAILRLLGN